MRFSIILITLALLPLLMILHGWIYTDTQLPGLRAQVLAALRDNGIRSPVVDLRYLDLHVSGSAADPQTLASARQAVSSLGPLRLVADDLAIPASLRARLGDGTLTLEGWLPQEESIREVTLLISKLRPDLALQTDVLHTDPQVRWPDGEKRPLTASSGLLAPIIEKLRVAPWLEIVRDGSGVRLQGMLPANGLRDALLSHLTPGDEKDLLESTHALAASFAEPSTLLPLVKSFFAGSTSRRFSINVAGEPTLEGAATRSLESEWLSLLRPVTGSKRVSSKLTFYPSEYHFPGHRPVSVLSATQMEALSQALSGHPTSFAPGSQLLSAEEQARLAALTPVLLTAGPAVKLLIGGHPDPAGEPETERKLAKSRAGEVHSFLVEQGLPASDVQTAAFDSVPPGTPGAPAQTRSVEILIR